jgi:hypothetical protein
MTHMVLAWFDIESEIGEIVCGDCMRDAQSQGAKMRATRVEAGRCCVWCHRVLGESPLGREHQ